MSYDFDKIARSYDRLNRVMTLGLDRRWRHRAAKELAVCKLQMAVLDVACGTGDMSIELIKQNQCVTGVDLSKEMLDIALKKTERGRFPLSLYEYLLADAEALPFADGEFNAVTCAFGVRNFVHLEQGLDEMIRVMKPGGRMVILELSTPDSKLIRPFYNFYTRLVIPWLGQRLAGNREAYTYLPESIERFPKGKAMLQILENLGLKAEQEKLFFGVCRMYKCEKK